MTISANTATRKLPPTPERLIEAISRVDAADLPLALLHLAMPVDAVVPIAGDLDSGRWRYRDLELQASADPLADVLQLVYQGHRDGDTYLGLDASEAPHLWTKIVVSGSRKMLFGSDLIYGGPVMAAEPNVTNQAMFELLQLVAETPEIDLPAVIELDDELYLVDGSSHALTVRSSDSHPRLL